MPHISKVVTIECAGNKRGLMEPTASGDQFMLDTIGNAKWTGVPLLDILDSAGIQENVKEILFTGSDSGFRPDMYDEATGNWNPVGGAADEERIASMN